MNRAAADRRAAWRRAHPISERRAALLSLLRERRALSLVRDPADFCGDDE